MKVTYRSGLELPPPSEKLLMRIASALIGDMNEMAGLVGMPSYPPFLLMEDDRREHWIRRAKLVYAAVAVEAGAEHDCGTITP